MNLASAREFCLQPLGQLCIGNQQVVVRVHAREQDRHRTRNLCLAKLAAAHRGETIVAVSHADPIKAALADALGTHLDLFQRIVVSPCSVSAIWYATSGPVVLTSNSTGDDLTTLGLS